MADQETFTLAQIALVEQARESAATSARRAQDAVALTDADKTAIVEIRQEIEERQEQIEEAISNNIPDHEWDTTSLRLKNADDSWGAFVDLKGAAGDDGWQAALAIETDGERRVLKVVDWFGGSGAKPATGLYVGAAGLVEAIGDAVDVRGATGAANTLTLGTVTTGAAGTDVEIEITGTVPNQTINFTIPRGDTGAAGTIGTAGADGVGVASAAIDGSNHLVLTLTDSSVIDAGSVVAFTLDTDGALAANSDAVVATQKAVKTYVDGMVEAANALQYKGTLACAGNPNYPEANAGHMYIVSSAGKIGGASGLDVEVGDALLCKTDGTASGNHAAVGAQWTILQFNLVGALTAANIGSTVQAYDTDLAAIAALVSSDNKLAYATGAGTWALTDLSAFGRSLIDDTDAASARATLEVAWEKVTQVDLAATTPSIVNISLPTGYEMFKLVMNGGSTTGTAALTISCSSDGVTFGAGSTILTPTNAANIFSFSLDLLNHRRSNKPLLVVGPTLLESTASSVALVPATNNVTHIRLSSNNYDAGLLTLYGLKS